MKQAIVNGRIIGSATAGRGYVEWDGGVITVVGEGDYQGDAGLVTDAGGDWVSPGFIDIHTHGAGGHDFMDGTEEAFRPHPTDPLKSRTALQNLTIQQDLRKYGVATDFFCQVGGGHNEASWEKQIPRFMHFLWQ